MVRNGRTVSRPGGLHRAAYFALAPMIAVVGALGLTFSASAAGPPIDGHTSPNDARCLRLPTENLFFLNQPTPSAGNPTPGSTIGAWFSDESGLNQGSADPLSPFYISFDLTGPGGVNEKLAADLTESFDQRSLFDTTHKECKIQVNIKTVIPATLNGKAYAPGDYKVTMTAWDNDQTRQGGDHSDQAWHFSIVAPSPSPTPTPTPTPQPSPSPTDQVLPAASASPVTGVLAASTTGPSLPRAGAGARSSGPAQLFATVLLFVVVGTLGVVIARKVRDRRLQ